MSCFIAMSANDMVVLRRYLVVFLVEESTCIYFATIRSSVMAYQTTQRKPIIQTAHSPIDFQFAISVCWS